MSDPNLPPPPGGAPPPGAQPPAQPYGGGGAPLDVGSAISYGWKKFSENAAQFILLVLAVFVVLVVLNIVQFVLTPDSTGFGALLWSLVLSLVMMVVTFIVQAGIWRGALAVTRGEEPQVSMLTETTNIGPYIITSIIVGIGTVIGLFLCVIPGLIWLIFTAFAPILSLDQGMGPGDAISTSINWVKEHFGTVFVILLVAWLVYVAGVIVCFVGLLVSIPVALTAIVYSYRSLSGQQVAP